MSDVDVSDGVPIDFLDWQRCRKVPVVVQYASIDHLPRKVPISTREGLVFAYPGVDYIIRGVDGELAPIKKDVFERTYQKIISAVIE
jgi:hypothetical protein